jgi:hypothetical protein
MVHLCVHVTNLTPGSDYPTLGVFLGMMGGYWTSRDPKYFDPRIWRELPLGNALSYLPYFVVGESLGNKRLMQMLTMPEVKLGGKVVIVAVCVLVFRTEDVISFVRTLRYFQKDTYVERMSGFEGGAELFTWENPLSVGLYKLSSVDS